jgi:hypothetical protein
MSCVQTDIELNKITAAVVKPHSCSRSKRKMRNIKARVICADPVWQDNNKELDQQLLRKWIRFLLGIGEITHRLLRELH